MYEPTNKTPSRRLFITKVLAPITALPLVSWMLSACGNPIGKVIDENKYSAPYAVDCSSGTTTFYANPVNHLHTTVSLSALELDAAEPGPYLLLDGDHKHYVTLTATNFSDIKNGQSVQKMDEDGHGHLIILSC